MGESMDKKEDAASFDAKINPFDMEKKNTFLNYRKDIIYHIKIFADVVSHKRKVMVKKVTDDLEYRKFKSRSFKSKVLILLAYLIAIITAEIAINYSQIELGLTLEVIILFALLINLSISESYSFSNLLMAMMVLPIIRIIGLSVPMMQIEHLYWFPIVSIPLFAASYTLIKAQNLNRENIGLVLGNIPIQLTVALSGVILGFTEYLILKPQPLISSFTLETVLIASIIMIISTGFAEELLFRGILQKNAESVLGKAFGLLYVSMLFTALHIGWQSSLDLVFVFGVALFYGYIFQRTKSLLGITLSHGISNVFLFLIVPFIFPALVHYI